MGQDTVHIFTIDSLTGDLTPAGTTSIAPGESISALAFSADGAHLYVASYFEDAVYVFARNAVTGALTFTDMAENGVGGVTDLVTPQGIAVSPDGDHVYVAATSTYFTGPETVVVFARNSLTGELTFASSVEDGALGVDGIDDAEGVTVGPDGANVYVSGPGESAVASFLRNPVTGALTYLGKELLGGPGIAAGPLTASADNVHVYAGSSFANSGSVFVFERTAPFGALSLVQSDYEENSTHIAFGPSENYLVVQGSNTIGLYRREPDSGFATFVERMGGPPFLADVTAGGSPWFAYAVGDGTASFTSDLYRVDIESPVAAYKIGNGSILTGPQLTDVVTASDRAIGLSSERLAAIDRNTDGDMDDEIAVVFDASGAAGQTRFLDHAVDRVAISEDIVVLAVDEFAEGDTDRNGDGDRYDSVLAIAAADGSTAVTNLGVAVDEIGANGQRVVAITPEGSEPAGNVGCLPTVPPGGCDLNGDGDALDRVLRVYEVPSAAFSLPAQGAQAAEDFVASNRYIAFRTPEDDQPGIAHLDSDGVADGDLVMQVYDPINLEVIPTNRSAMLCTILGCDPLIPYKIDPLRETVSFLTDENEEGADLDGDGDALDIVLSVFSVTARQVRTVSKIHDDDAAFLETLTNPIPLFQGEAVTQDTIFTTARECDYGVDINDDGDAGCDDVVVLLAGDADGDGLFDDFDDCVEGYNPDGVDADGDGLGDAACDLEVALCPPAPLAGCKQTSSGRASFSVIDNAGTSKDRLSWRWKDGDATALSELGDPLGGRTFYQLCLYDGSGGAQPLREASVVPGGTCGKKPCWTAKPGKGLSFEDKRGFPNGIRKVSLGIGGPGEARAQIVGKGDSLVLRLLPLTGPATVQLVGYDAGVQQSCWTATFSSPTKNEGGGRFKARSD